MGGIIVKYFPDCYSYDEGELNRILSVALQTRASALYTVGNYGLYGRPVFCVKNRYASIGNGFNIFGTAEQDREIAEYVVSVFDKLVG